MTADSRSASRHRRLGLALVVAIPLLGIGAQGAAESPAGAARPALTVTLAAPETHEWPRLLAATGTIAAWQEAVIGAEIGGYRVTEVLVDVGDRVREGQLLIRIDSDTVAAELDQARASVAEAEAMLAQARDDGDRARQVKGTAAMSAQQASQYLTSEQTALARLVAARAKVRTEELRLTQTRVLAPDDGVISARLVSMGSLAQPGQDLLRLIRGGRLEWRAEVPATELSRLAIGGEASVITPDGGRFSGRIRQVAPTVDPRTLTGLVYVDLPLEATGTALRAGMFVRGELDLGRSEALTLPQSALLLRDGFAYVLRIGADDRVTRVKVQVDRRLGDRVEIVGGLDPTARVVASGTGFLTDGDRVRVVEAPPPILPPAEPASPR
ncbi:efflux RND transporter periplasmic adaptor subunit [Thiocystis violacea]|uniref:efflux RND transporter periplasmic adaptor subunit n=1 Tax=Thiocystis violacea TaxID=13725 RepID=UPI0019088093|nr:efflux RND transporter periplasmic adaptor subunit [Thiocystis violacea]MBK1719615.1 efflux transporter periplasmic adaptor subunit [Thiocystis violacea]